MGKLRKTAKAMMLLAILGTQPAAAGNDVIITRDGTLVKARVYKVGEDITYTDLDMKDGVRAISKSKVFMLLRDNASSLYYDESGRQLERPHVSLSKNADMLFFNDGKVLTVYDLSISNGEVTYRLDKKGTTPERSTQASQIFMIRGIDGSTMLMKPKTWERKAVAQKPAQPAPAQRTVVKEAAQEAPANGNPVTLPAKEKIPVISVAEATAAAATKTPVKAEPAKTEPAVVQPAQPVQPAAATTTPAEVKPATTTVQPEVTRVTAVPTVQPATPTQPATPAQPAATPEPAAPAVPAQAAPAGMSLYELEKKVREKEPYVLFRNDAMVEYRFQQGGYMTAYAGKTTFLQQRVNGFTVEDGLLKVNQTQAYYTKKRTSDKAMDEALEGSLFYVEIDQDGNSMLSHNVMHDFIRVAKREGYGVVLPSELTPGMTLKCGTIKDSGTDLHGRSVSRTLTYRGWAVEKEEHLQTEAGILPCVKLTGQVAVSTSTGTSMVENVTCWVSRGVGFVRYDSAVEGSSKPVVLALVGMKNVK